MRLARTRPALLGLAFALVVAGLPWAVVLAAIPPARQDFPLIDDWAFWRGAVTFFRGEGIDYQSWASMPLLGQWVWTVPFLAVLGPSHLAARAATVVLSWFALWAFFDLLRRGEKVSTPVAAFATACLAWNPYFFLLSGTYMSDVPALSFSLIALALYARALDGGRWLLLAAAVAVALAGVATRQNAIAAPLAAGVLLLGSRYRAPRLWIRLLWFAAAALAVALPVVAALALHAWLGRRHDVVPLQARWPEPDWIVWLVFTSLHYLGLMAAPLLVLVPARLGRVFWAALLVMGVGAACVAVVGQPWPHEGVFPYLEDVIMARGTYVMMEGDRPPLFSWGLRLVPTALGCVCAAAWIARASEASAEVGLHPPALFSLLKLVALKLVTLVSHPYRFLLELVALAARLYRLLGKLHPLVIFSLLQLGLLLVAPKFYDRYLLPLAVGALAVAARRYGPPRWPAGLVTLGLLGGLSVCLMHDWLSWNAARWELGRRAAASPDRIEPQDIEGGMEWDHTYRPTHPRHYRLSLSPSPAEVAVDVQPYTLWLPPRTGRIYLLRMDRTAPGAGSSR
jgi:hypothetical protein